MRLANPANLATRKRGSVEEVADEAPIPWTTWAEHPEPPPPRRWLVRDWLPAGRVALLTGPGGICKSRLVLQLAAGIASGGGQGDAWKKGGRNGVGVRGAGGPGSGSTPDGGTIRIGGRVPWGAEVEYAYRAGYDSRGRVSVTHVVDERGYGAMLTQPELDGAGPGEDRTSP